MVIALVDVMPDSDKRDWVYGRARLQLDFPRHKAIVGKMEDRLRNVRGNSSAHAPVRLCARFYCFVTISNSDQRNSFLAANIFIRLHCTPLFLSLLLACSLFLSQSVWDKLAHYLRVAAKSKQLSIDGCSSPWWATETTQARAPTIAPMRRLRSKPSHSA